MKKASVFFNFGLKHTAYYLFVMLLPSLMIIGCFKESDPNLPAQINLDCYKFQQEMILMDLDSLRNTLQPILDLFTPEPVEEDELGHKENFMLLLNLLNEECSALSFSMSCYACIETYPPITEIQVYFPDDGIKILDIRTSDSEALEFLNIHE